MENKEIKKYVLDTSVLCTDPDSIFKFKEHQIILPIIVIYELDNLKKGNNDAAKNARMVSRKIKELCDKYGDLNSPIPINDKGGTIKVDINWKFLIPHACNNILDIPRNLLLDFDDEKMGNDNKIINTAYINNAILVTKDNNLRIVSSAYGIKSEDYENEKVDVSDLYTGIYDALIPEGWIDNIYRDGYLQAWSDDFYPNQCLIMKSNHKHSALGIYDAKNQNIKLVPQVQRYYEIQPKNTEQKFLLELLFDKDIKLLTVTGVPGSGKTILAIIASLYQVMEQQEYKKVIITRSPMSIDKDVQLGFLPGDLQSKLSPWMGSMYDNIDYVMGKVKSTDKRGRTRKKNKDLDDDKDIGITNGVTELMEYGILEMLSLEHVRGRSLRNSIVIVDECQNINTHILKTIITRIGENSKIILLGDIKQVDASYLDSSNNGLVYCIEKFKGQEIYGHINLVRSERSKLAELADKLL